MPEKRVTSTDIKFALKELHEKRNTYFITECKTCSTYFPDPQGLLIFDGLAITKSYTKPCITGYEIKISRSDFLQDAKWHLYLQYCNEFFFVVPKGLIKKDELPDNVGLIYYNQETDVLRTVKKALYREIKEPVGVYKYIIYSRLEEDRIPFYENRTEYAKAYLDDKKDKKYVGGTLGSKLAADVSAAYEKLEAAERELKNLNIDLWKAVQKVLTEHKIMRYWHNSPEEVTEELEKKLSGSYPEELISIKKSLQYTLEQLEKVEEQHLSESKGG